MTDKDLLGKVVLLHREDEPQKAKLYLINDSLYDYYSGGTVTVKTVRDWIKKGLKLTFYSEVNKYE